MADPKVAEHKLFKQGQIFGRASTTDEKIPDIAPDYRGHGATPQEKEDENKAWISNDHTLANADAQNRDESSRPQPDVYAQEVNKRLGPLTSVTDKIADGLEKMSGTAKNSTGGMFSQYTNAAWEKMSAMKPTIGANEPPKQESTLDQRMAEISEKGLHETNVTAEKAKEKTPTMPDVGYKLLAAGGDDVMKILADGGSTQGDYLKANMRATAEMLE